MHAMSNIRIFMIAHEVSRYSVFCVQDNRIYTAQKKVVYYYHPRLKKDAFRFKYNSQLQKQKGSPSVFTKKKGQAGLKRALGFQALQKKQKKKGSP